MKADLSDLKIEMQAQISSINTEIEKRDQHLQSPDFFDAAKYPALVFKSTSFRKTKGNLYKLSGTLTMKGVTRPIVFSVIHASGKNPMNGKTVHGFTLSGTLNRLDYGVGDVTLKTGIGSEVKLSANVEFVQE
jgi:polyisoprenoid-binding protein YceI